MPLLLTVFRRRAGWAFVDLFFVGQAAHECWVDGIAPTLSSAQLRSLVLLFEGPCRHRRNPVLAKYFQYEYCLNSALRSYFLLEYRYRSGTALTANKIIVDKGKLHVFGVDTSYFLYQNSCL